MNSHVSAILLGVKDMERSKRFYVDGLGWKVESDYKISVFFVPHGGSLIGFYGREDSKGFTFYGSEGFIDYFLRRSCRTLCIPIGSVMTILAEELARFSVRF